MYLNKLFFVLLLLPLYCSAQNATEWNFIQRTTDGNASVYLYYLPQEIDINSFSIWTQIKYNKPKQTSYGLVASVTELMRIDNNDRKLKTLQKVYHSSKGAVLHSAVEDYSEYEYPIPGTIGQAIYTESSDLKNRVETYLESSIVTADSLFVAHEYAEASTYYSNAENILDKVKVNYNLDFIEGDIIDYIKEKQRSCSIEGKNYEETKQIETVNSKKEKAIDNLANADFTNAEKNLQLAVDAFNNLPINLQQNYASLNDEIKDLDTKITSDKKDWKNFNTYKKYADSVYKYNKEEALEYYRKCNALKQSTDLETTIADIDQNIKTEKYNSQLQTAATSFKNLYATAIKNHNDVRLDFLSEKEKLQKVYIAKNNNLTNRAYNLQEGLLYKTFLQQPLPYDADKFLLVQLDAANADLQALIKLQEKIKLLTSKELKSINRSIKITDEVIPDLETVLETKL